MNNEALLNLNVKVFADGADLDRIRTLNYHPLVKGFTTNPTLMRKAGVVDYEVFARQVLDIITQKPVSFEVFADDLEVMYWQARKISSWGQNVNVKIPITNTQGEFTGPILEKLSNEGVLLNVTAMMTIEQIKAVCKILSHETPAILSVFAGRIADTGRDPVPYMKKVVKFLEPMPRFELLWASPREVLNVFHADAVGCDIITVTEDLLNKLELTGKDLNAFSLETVEMFYRDASAAGYIIGIEREIKIEV